MEYVKIIALCLITIGFWVIILFGIFKKKPVEKIVKMDEYTTERYLKCLSDMISLITLKLFNAKVGELERRNMVVISDMNNPDMIDIHDAIVRDIFSKMSENMSNYLVLYFGKDWLISYVSDMVRTIIIENTKKLNIKSED